MAFIKGQAKTGGRRTGTKNALGREIRERIKKIVECRLDAVETILERLDPKEQIVVLLKLMEYVVPKAYPGQEEEVEEKVVHDFSRLPLEKLLLLQSLIEETTVTPEQE